jgi:hypothetical protein
MTALPQQHGYVIDQTIHGLGQKWSSFHNIGFSHDEFLELFVSREHADMLKTVADIAHVGNSPGGWLHAEFAHSRLTAALGVEKANLMFGVNPVKDYAPLLPRNNVVLESAPPEVLDRLADWVIERAEIGFNISRARLVYNWLNTKCKTANEMRFLWPSIVALCSLDERTQEYGAKLRDVKPPKAVAFLPPEVKEGCRKAAGTIASAMLLGEPPPFKAPVTVTLAGVGGTRREGALGILSAGG